MRAEIILYDGFDDLDAFAPYEILRRVAMMGANFSAHFVTVDERESVTSAFGVVVKTPQRLGQPDLLLVPGGGWAARASSSAWVEAERGVIPGAISAAHERGALIATVCTGAMLAAAAGLTRGRHCITHHAAIADLRAAGAEVVFARVVDDGDLISSGGVTSGLDLALWLVERLFGPERASAIESQIEYERRGTVWREG